LGGEFDAGDGARNRASLFVALRLAVLLLDVRTAVALQVGEADFVERRNGNAVAVLAVVIDLDLGAGGERGGACGVIDELADLGEIDGVRIADVEIGDGAVGDYVGRGAAFGDDALNAGFGAMRMASMLLKSWMTPSRALRPAQGVIWWAGAPLKMYLTPSIFRQQVPKPGAGRVVALWEWLRTRISMPSKTWALNICILATGGIISSPGVPNTVTLPGR
jgi:hypothetical protein